MPTDPAVIDPGGTPLPSVEVTRTVTQSEKGVPLHEWTRTRVEPARRPDGSIVYVKATNVVEGFEEDTAAAARAEVAADAVTPGVDAGDTPTTTEEVWPEPRAVDFAHPGTVLVPSGEKARIEANLAALRIATQCVREGNRAATRDEQEALSRWSGWGAVPKIFDERDERWTTQRDELKSLMSERDYREARSSVLNAHYTSPEIAQAMWSALRRAGYRDGLVLEPGCGSGNFLAFAPQDATMVGVEIEPISAQIAHLLYPSAQVRNEGFELTRVPEGSFTATIGNVPFGDFAVGDPLHNPRGHNIHNHFLIKSLALTAPGGYVAAITSAYTLDTQSEKARRDMYALGDLVGAVRLPSNAFTAVAGTQVVTDILVFRRRDPERDPRPSPAETVDWLHSDVVEVPDRDGNWQASRHNRYFTRHPEHVMGEFRLDRGLYRDGTLVVRDTTDDVPLPGRITAALDAIVDKAAAQGMGLNARPVTVRQTQFGAGVFDAATLYEKDLPIGHVAYEVKADEFTRIGVDGVGEPLKIPASRRSETKHLLRLRDLTTAVITSQRDRSHATGDEREELRATLNLTYDAYVARYGPINRFTTSGGNSRSPEQAEAKLSELTEKWRLRNGSEEHGPYVGALPDEVLVELEERAWQASPLTRRQTHLEALRRDPAMAAVMSLEIFDETTTPPSARKAAVFARDVVVPPVPVVSADSPAEALSISIGESGVVDLARISGLLGVDMDTAREQLRGLIFDDPQAPGQLQPAASALSGNIRTKLDAVEAALMSDPTNRNWAELASALNERLPEPLPPSRIAAALKPGPTWITHEDYAQFVLDVFGASSATVERGAGHWTVNVPPWEKNTGTMRTEFGADNQETHKQRNAVELFEMLLNQEPIVIRNSQSAREDGAPEVDAKATMFAQVQSEKIVKEFQSWIFSEDERTDRLVGEWNRRFNSWVRPEHDGSGLTFPGLGPTFVPMPHQRNAVARVLAEPTVLFDHVVGAGKTGEMFMGAMELKRRSLVRQPWIVVPTHLIEQFGREVRQWYPAANVLVGRKGMNDEERRVFAAQTATTDFDMVIVPASVFELIRVHPDRHVAYIEAQLDELHQELSNDNSEATVKQIERSAKAMKKKLDKALEQSGKDTGVLFEDTGCDYLFVDEAHEYKNKGRTCSIASLSLVGSNKAEDLSMKLSILRERRQDEARAKGIVVRPGAERVATFATGTPIANSLAEAWVMQQYLRPDLLEEAGVRSITDWAATFTTTRSETVTNATGTQLKVVSRVSSFANPKQLAMLSAQYTDVVLRDQVPAVLPKYDGREIVSTSPPQEIRDFIADLEYRLEAMTPQTTQTDNVLKVLNDGRNAALDPRLVNLPVDDWENTRVAAVAGKISQIYRASADNIYRDEAGQESDIRGGVQTVFCDRGTPKPGRGFTLYAGLKDALVANGVPVEKIAFIHDAKTAAQKLALFAACRAGHIQVLIGSTPKMGTGMNVQQRMIAEHHMDVPWRPADLEQREGRIIRQGNQNERIRLLNYVTEGTTDTVMWGKVESKATFIEQYRSGQLEDVALVDDIEEETSLADAAAATKAAATGDERFLLMAQLQDDVKKLGALEAASIDARNQARRMVSSIERELPRLADEIERLEELTAGHDQWIENGKPFTIEGDGGKGYSDRPERSEALLAAVQAAWGALRHKGAQHLAPLATFPNGLTAYAVRHLVGDEMEIIFSDCPGRPNIKVKPEQMFTAQGGQRSATASGLATRVENLYSGISEMVFARNRTIRQLEQELAVQAPRVNSTFEHSEELSGKRAALHEIRLEIEQAAKSEEAMARKAAAQARLRAAGRTEGWSLELNPTRNTVAQSPFTTATQYVRAQQAKHAMLAAEWTAEDGQTLNRAERTGPQLISDALSGVDVDGTVIDEPGLMSTSTPDESGRRRDHGTEL